jgi:hypothetical protein
LNDFDHQWLKQHSSIGIIKVLAVHSEHLKSLVAAFWSEVYRPDKPDHTRLHLSKITVITIVNMKYLQKPPKGQSIKHG